MVDSISSGVPPDFGGIHSEQCEQNANYTAVFEDDGRVAYAYLCEDEEIVSDVWLYNNGDTPLDPEWDDMTNAPFKNSSDYVFDRTFAPVSEAAEIKFHWKHNQPGKVSSLEVFLHGLKIAVLKPGSKPGWSALAKRSGPLANPILDTPEE